MIVIRVYIEDIDLDEMSLEGRANISIPFHDDVLKGFVYGDDSFSRTYRATVERNGDFLLVKKVPIIIKKDGIEYLLMTEGKMTLYKGGFRISVNINNENTKPYTMSVDHFAEYEDGVFSELSSMDDGVKFAAIYNSSDDYIERIFLNGKVVVFDNTQAEETDSVDNPEGYDDYISTGTLEYIFDVSRYNISMCFGDCRELHGYYSKKKVSEKFTTLRIMKIGKKVSKEDLEEAGFRDEDVNRIMNHIKSSMSEKRKNKPESRLLYGKLYSPGKAIKTDMIKETGATKEEVKGFFMDVLKIEPKKRKAGKMKNTYNLYRADGGLIKENIVSLRNYIKEQRMDQGDELDAGSC